MPEEWPWEEAKKLFEKPDVLPADEIEVRSYSHLFNILASLLIMRKLDWKAPDVDGLVDFLVREKGFKYEVSLTLHGKRTNEVISEERVRKGAEKLSKHLNAKQQGRLDGFFSVTAKPKEDAKGKGAAKGKKDDAKKGGKRKVS